MIFKFIYKLGQKLRNPSLDEIFSFLKETESWSRKDLEDYQLRKLKELIYSANLNSKFYRKKFENIDLETKELKDLEKIPTLSKDELLQNSKNIQSNFKFKKLFKANTSGTSGNSLTFFRDEFSDSFNRASISRGYSWHNVKPWEKNGYFWGFNFTFPQKVKTSLLDFLQNRFRVFGYDSKSFNSFVFKLKKAKYIHGYSSMIYQTAKIINNKNLPKPNHISMIKGTSEKIFDSYQEEIIKAFGSRMINEYGATESGIIGFECSYGNIHVNMEGVIVEEVNNEILVTNLQMKSFPIIRYKLGDYIKLAPTEKKCRCGLKHQIIEEITGRVGKNVYGKEDIYPSLYFYYIFKNLDKNYGIKLNYKVVQEEKGTLNFYIENFLLQENKILLEKEITKYFKEDIEYIIVDSANLFSKIRKTTSFVSHIE